MPFIADVGDDIVWPDEVDDDVAAVCPECGEQMHVRTAHRRDNDTFVHRHFVHNRSTSRCGGGESDEHKLMKYITTRRLGRVYQHGNIERETRVPGTDRIGDVVVTFEKPVVPLGHGVIAEVQYRNDDKDILGVTEEYHDAGFSVYWLHEQDFGDDFETLALPELVTPFPHSVPEPDEWQGKHHRAHDLEQFGSQPAVEVRMPPDFVEANRQTLETACKIGAGKYDFDLVYDLRQDNAGRKCDICGESAAAYLFDEGAISTFRCDDHLVGPHEVMEA